MFSPDSFPVIRKHSILHSLLGLHHISPRERKLQQCWWWIFSVRSGGGIPDAVQILLFLSRTPSKRENHLEKAPTGSVILGFFELCVSYMASHVDGLFSLRTIFVLLELIKFAGHPTCRKSCVNPNSVPEIGWTSPKIEILVPGTSTSRWTGGKAVSIIRKSGCEQLGIRDSGGFRVKFS